MCLYHHRCDSCRTCDDRIESHGVITNVISMIFLQSCVGMELMCVYHHRCNGCRTSIRSSVMIELSLMVLSQMSHFYDFSPKLCKNGANVCVSPQM